MKLTPREKDKLLISLAAIVAKNRLSTAAESRLPLSSLFWPIWRCYFFLDFNETFLKK